MRYHEEMEQLEIPRELPVLPVRDMVVFPDMIAPLFVSRELSVSAVESAIEDRRLVLALAQRRLDAEQPSAEDLYRVGTVGMVVRMRRLPDERLKILLQGIAKARLEGWVQERPHYVARLQPIQDLPLDELSVETEALIRTLREKLDAFSQISDDMGPDLVTAIGGIGDPGRLADLVASNLGMPVDAAQRVLETPDPVRRLRAVVEHMTEELELRSTKARIEKRVLDELDKSRREYFLREQMRQIRSELGEAEDERVELAGRIERAGMPQGVREEAERQLQRLAKMHADSAEAGSIRTHLEWLLELEWTSDRAEQVDLEHARSVLDEAHLGLEPVKQRVLEYLSVRKLNPDRQAPVLCLLGPPGVGKTSLGRSIARALHRRFARISLGGLRDQAELRGHRRTYVGAMPGRIVQAVRQAGSCDPVLLLDEIDKLGADVRGDPASVLLEVLDPEQNNAFVDHYLNVPFDLSRVVFVTTANRADTIPPALLDRLELIQLPGYSLRDKTAIARRFLLPRQLERCGLEPGQIEIEEEVIERLIERHTQEAGLRQLERAIAAICRKTAHAVAGGGRVPGRVEAQDLRAYLGPSIHRPLELLAEDAVGIAHALAWTPAGGQVLQIEALQMSGRGEIILTGQLGDVMRESARTALSCARALGDARGWRGDWAELDTHIHVPAGAIPKDGPSAGLPMAVVLVSLLSGLPVRRQIAMTGEISLRGRLLPVGGLRGKILAAQRAGIAELLIPAGNGEDLDTLPAEVKSGMTIRPVATLGEALAYALCDWSA
ncbi:MAG: endopeptidase La [Deltaproteobacteria bacterium]|nr:endopeptidase La [Deltaproteobacteria bacterium]